MAVAKRKSVVMDLTDMSNDDETTPIPNLLPQTPLKRPAPTLKSSLSPEGETFFKDLNNFLAIGSLVVAPSTDSRQEPVHWEEVFGLSSITGLSEHLIHDIHKLLASRLVRLFSSGHILRVYILPDDVGHRFVEHQNRKLEGSLFSLLKALDVSPEAWNGRPHPYAQQEFELFSAKEDGSLFYLFNNIPSPNPSVDNVKNHFYRIAMSELLDPETKLSGLKTDLYPYQRRSAALMLQRECVPSLELDPRLEERFAVDGSVYYYGPWDVLFLRSPRFYETCKGGILAETMGLGKTVISIALILSTKGHLPEIPAQYDKIMTRPTVGSLVEMAITSVNRHSAPWRTFFDRHEEITGEHMGHCISLMRRNAPSYEVPVEPIRRNRKTTLPAPKRMTLAATTIIVVPTNLLAQWQSELTKHCETNSLKTLIMKDNKQSLPPPDELALFDVVLFSRPRFEIESRDGSDSRGRRIASSKYPVSCQCPYIGATRTRRCDCIRTDDLYSSPLKYLHFLRIIIDEGHAMSSENTRIALVASKLVEADHRWVVSGTPAKDLLGVEMDFASGPVSGADSPRDTDQRDAMSNRNAYTQDEINGAIQNIASMARSFLRIRPWSTGPGEDRAADWKDYFFRHEMLQPRVRTFSSYSKCLRRILESTVIKTRPEDVERDIELPPLFHDIVRLEPSFYDKLTANAFALVLTANAVTSERTDADYIFHKNSAKARSQLLSNLRQSAFFWTGFTGADIEAAQSQSQQYLRKTNKSCSVEDQELLTRCIDYANNNLNSVGWKALSTCHEIGLFIEYWPDESANFWSFDKSQMPVLCGATQLIQAQDHVNHQASSIDPTEGLPGAGLRALAVLHPAASSNTIVKAGIPTSLVSDQSNHRRASKVHEKQKTPDTSSQLPLDSELRRTKIMGTTSSKMSYLISRILEFHQDEKILVFYDGENTAYYIAQVLELLHINHLIYAKSLTQAKRSEYVVQFNQDPQYRVLLMDVGQAAYGLNIPSASRVFFVNPMNRPHDEAQALKRAHRIGQTREVRAETLILRDTIEEEMFERARRMTRVEHRNAKELDDDAGIRNIIQNVTPVSILPSEYHGNGAVAFLEEPQQLWGRPGWGAWKAQQHVERGKKRKATAAGVERGKKRQKTPKQSTVEPTSAVGSPVVTREESVPNLVMEEVPTNDGVRPSKTNGYLNSIFGGGL